MWLLPAGLLRRVLSWLAPSWTVTVLVAAAASTLALASGAAALALGVVTIVLHR